ncbi:ubiquitin carboxyl-terminal hydrolase 32-like isoform X2 [Saccostrea cucullata]|uniref:ubiquitin carboxyl-terminal hydrolase 32-like isoform X2 n=1 Tax=Saccostrea cuccullata TaxID=36930 RepID=UPI002ED2386C
MGGKESKLQYFPFEEACRRMKETELKRSKDAFKRVATLGGQMSDVVFCREVLGEGVPPGIANLLYRGFGGTSKGLSLKDLLCGLVILTKGSVEEKIKFLFGMYADDSYSFVQKEEMDRLVLESEGQVSNALSDLFSENDQVTFDYFRLWVKAHPDATEMTKWLLMEPMTVSLSDDTDTPTFYQTLAGVTHLEETDISELEKRYWALKSQSKSGKFDLDTFKAMVCPPVPEAICESLFHAFDENRDNHIDFKEMACGISACCRGPGTERQKFCFKVFDINHDGKLCERELVQMVKALLRIRQENQPTNTMECDPFYNMDPELVAKEILASHDGDKDGCLTQAEYLVWTVNNTLADNFLDLLSQICHLVMGLKPQTKEEEGEIIKGFRMMRQWLQRESKKSFEIGQVWYLISMTWWNSWIEYVQPPMSNGRLDSGEQVRMNGTEAMHKITKSKHSSKALPWDDDSVIIVNMITKGKNSEYNTSINGGFKSSTIPQRSQSACSSPIKTCLSASDSNGLTSVSPGPSPKLRKKGLQQTNSQPVKPGPIDNTNLITPNNSKVISLTNEGGRLRRDTMLVRGKDFELVPEVIWRSLSTWYGGNIALPRTVIASKNNNGSPELELYPVTVKLLRHQVVPQRPNPTSFSGVMSGIGGMALSMTNYVSSAPPIPRRYVAFTATFSKQHTIQQVYEFLCTKVRFVREDIRLWKIGSKDDSMTLLEDESMTVEDCGVEENQSLLIEVRNKDLTWPEEMSQLAKNKTCRKEQVPTQKGATGLNNLGNTCFMNAAVQCVSNTWPLTQYFIGGLHLFELNRSNPLGMKGHIAQRYGELVKDLWSGTSKTIAPLKLRWTIGKYAPRFNGFQQHDSQELLSFLLDGLHEDLNRVHVKPYVELKDSDGRQDEVVAEEAWENHLRRNQSIIVDLFHGQLKSQVRCKECGHMSVRFDPFNYLSLPLPMDSCIHLEVIVTRLDGSVPVKYGIRLNMDEKYKALKKELSSLTGIPPGQILFVEIMGPIVKALPQDNHKVKTLIGGVLYAYELPPHEEIKPMTIEEEKGTVPKNSVGLNDIQRGLATKKIQQKLENGPTSMSTSLTVEDNSANNTPTHSRQPSDVPTMGSLQPTPENPAPKATAELFSGFVIGVHRKMNLMDVYFLSSQKARPGLFGTPIILPCVEDTTNQDLYQFVWTQVSRLVSPLPPSEVKSANHAQDCDDSLGYEYPFTLKVVMKDGLSCAWCPWYRFCRGCKLECNADDFNFGSSFLAIDWEPTALHLRYQTALERLYEDHESVEESRRKQTEPINLDTCLQAFTTEEELGEDELYYCSKCKKHCLASKKLDIWRLPPILIINLKRFQFLNGRWVKSHKIVNFPIEKFDPSNYLAPRAVSEQSVTCVCQSNNSAEIQPVPNGDIPNHNDLQMEVEKDDKESKALPCKKCQLIKNIPTADEPIKYDLSSMSCHTGILGGGHYVCYAKNPNQKWYCYNDSSCKECTVEQMDCNSAYILFYERENIDFSHFMPDVEGKEPDLQEIDDEFESDLKKACVIQ